MIILASASPRRAALLEQIGVSFVVKTSDVDETPQVDESPINIAKRLAKSKAQAVTNNTDWVLAADTVVDLDGVSLAKPADIEEAKTMLRQLSGKSHWVHTAICVCKAQAFVEVVSTKIFFAPLSVNDIHFLAQPNCLDKAGAYAIQQQAGLYISRIEGSYTNVVGLPLFETYGLLRAHHIIKS